MDDDDDDAWMLACLLTTSKSHFEDNFILIQKLCCTIFSGKYMYLSRSASTTH